jgi:hypothetical protein
MIAKCRNTMVTNKIKMDLHCVGSDSGGGGGQEDCATTPKMRL